MLLYNIWMLIVLFGLPGSGKTFTGKILKKNFGFYLHEGDKDLPYAMQRMLKKNGTITEKMRDSFFESIFNSLKKVTTEYKNIVVAQTFIKEKYRQELKEKFPHAQFVLVHTPDEIREKRLQSRTEYPLDLAYSRQMVADFDQPLLSHTQIDNSQDGTISVQEQFKKLFKEENQ